MICARSSILVALAATVPIAGHAAADPADMAPQSAVAVDNSNNGEDFTRPLTGFSSRSEFRSSSGATSQTTRERERLQFDSSFNLGSGWKIGTQALLPFVAKTTTSFVEPLETQTDTGIGDAVFQAALIHSDGARWAYGFGARLVAPTAADSLGSPHWEIMPGFGIRYSFLEINSATYFVPVVRYAISIGPSGRMVREPQIAPTFNVGLPDAWFITFYPSNDIRINYGTPVSGQTGRLFLPFDAGVGRTFQNNLILFLEASVPIIKDYPVYDFKTELKVTWKF